LGNIGPDATLAFGPLFNQLKDNKDFVRKVVSDALENVPPHKDDLAMLVKVAADAEEPMGMRVHAIKALGRLGSAAKSAAVPKLMALAKVAKDEDLRRASLAALLAIGPDSADVPDLAKMLKAGTPETKRQVLDILIRMGPEAQKAVSEIVAIFKSGDKTMKIQAGKALETMGPAAKAGVAALTDALKDADKEVALQAARALAKLDASKDAVTFLAGLVKSGGKEQRHLSVQAAQILGDIGPEARVVARDLANVLEDDALRVAALEALLKIGKGAAAAVSTKLTALVQKNASPEARLACIKCLGQIGQGSKEAGIALTNAFRFDPVEENRRAALMAGNKIAGKN
jgi:HEAT repeat protein